MTAWLALPDAEGVARAACERIAAAAKRAISQRGNFSLVLAGGTTPARAYHLLSATEQDWAAWSLYYGDERCLFPEDEQRNSRMVEASGLLATGARHYPIPAERGAEQAAADYSRIIAPVLPFDMVVLGVGEDGHTASLFPGRPFDRQAPAVAVHEAPKPPPDRVSLSLASLQACREMLVLVTGAGKRSAVAAWRAGESLPVAQVAALPQATVLVEQALVEE